MIILIALVILGTPFLVTRLLRARHARPVAPAQPTPFTAAGADTSSLTGAPWSALDDLQLTRLLTDSAHRSTTE